MYLYLDLRPEATNVDTLISFASFLMLEVMSVGT